MSPRVAFVDTSAIWKCRLHRRVYALKPQTVKWRGEDITAEVVEDGGVVVMEKNAQQLIESLLLEKVAHLVIADKIRLVTHDDALLASKLWARGDPYCRSGEFFGVDLGVVQSKIAHSREFGRGSKGVLQVHDFTDPQFIQVCEMLGAIQGGQVVGRKQIADAFLVNCALENGADAFLTLDRKLIGKMRGNEFGIEVVWPSELITKFLRFRVWRYVVSLFTSEPAIFIKVWTRLLKRAGVLIKEDDRTWTIFDKSIANEIAEARRLES